MHRGSAFGRRITEQPTQINFENQLAVDLLHANRLKTNKIFIEDESRAIGSLSVPDVLHEQMRQSPLAIIEEEFESRVSTILNDYIFSNFNDFIARQPATAKDKFSEFLLSALVRIKRRLGEEPYIAIRKLMEQGLEQNNLETSTELHNAWISKLLKDYYDPMYEYQLAKKSHRIVFRGNKTEFIAWESHINR